LIFTQFFSSLKKVFIPAQRAQFLSDSFELSIAGVLDITLPLNLSSYLIAETDYLPWMAASRNFLHLDFFLQNSPEYPLFQVKIMEKQWNNPKMVLSCLRNTCKDYFYHCIGNSVGTNPVLRINMFRTKSIFDLLIFCWKTWLLWSDIFDFWSWNKFVTIIWAIVAIPQVYYCISGWWMRICKRTIVYCRFIVIVIDFFPGIFHSVSSEIKGIIKCYGLLHKKNDSRLMNFVLTNLKDPKSTTCSDEKEKLYQ